MALPRVHGTLPRGLVQGGGSFALNIGAWVEQTKERADLVVRQVAIDLLSSVIDKSPVGNPELWAANAGALYARANYNLFAAATGARTLSNRTLKKKFKLTAGKGYVGGRFKGNWQVQIGAPATGEISRVDAKGATTLADGTAAAGTARAGDVIFITNNVPYAQRLEYGWSKQAPSGVVGITVTQFQSIVNLAVQQSRAVKT